MIRFLFFMFLLFGPTGVLAQTSTTYSNTTTGTINDNDCGTASQVVRTFVVAGNAIVGDVDLAVVANHTYRSDLRLTLQSPAGTAVTVMTWTGNVQSGDNLNDLFDDEAAAAITTHVATAIDPTTGAPHSFRPSNPLSAFDGQNPAGTWTMTLCDAVAADTGNFIRADLTIRTTSLTATKTSKIISDPINTTTNPKMIPGALVEYCILATNAGVTGVTPSTGISLNDVLPATLSYVSGSMRSGATCAAATTVEDDDATGADESDPFGMSISGTTITGTTGSMAAGATFAMVFRATIN